MNKELENKALEIIQKLRTYDPVAGDNPRLGFVMLTRIQFASTQD